MKSRLQKLKLNKWCGSLIASDQVAEFTENVATNAHHVLMAGRLLKSIEARLGCVALNIFAIGDDLDDSMPDFFGDVIAGDADKLKNDIHIPVVVGRVFFR